MNWHYTIEALIHMACGVKFCFMVKALLGNASARMSINGNLSNFLRLSRSIKQGCPLDPLFYAVVADGVNWLNQDRIV